MTPKPKVDVLLVTELLKLPSEVAHRIVIGGLNS